MSNSPAESHNMETNHPTTIESSAEHSTPTNAGESKPFTAEGAGAAAFGGILGAVVFSIIQPLMSRLGPVQRIGLLLSVFLVDVVVVMNLSQLQEMVRSANVHIAIETLAVIIVLGLLLLLPIVWLSGLLRSAREMQMQFGVSRSRFLWEAFSFIVFSALFLLIALVMSGQIQLPQQG